MNLDFWKGLLVGLFIGAAITLVVTGFYAWAAIGAVPLIGKAIQYKIKRKVGLEKPKRTTSFSLRKRGIHSNR